MEKLVIYFVFYHVHGKNFVVKFAEEVSLYSQPTVLEQIFAGLLAQIVL